MRYSQLHILLPPLMKLRTIVDRLRPMSDVLAIRANNNGHLTLSINTEGVKVDTEWKDCTNPKSNVPLHLLVDMLMTSHSLNSKRRSRWGRSRGPPGPGPTVHSPHLRAEFPQIFELPRRFYHHHCMCVSPPSPSLLRYPKLTMLR